MSYRLVARSKEGQELYLCSMTDPDKMFPVFEWTPQLFKDCYYDVYYPDVNSATSAIDIEMRAELLTMLKGNCSLLIVDADSGETVSSRKLLSYGKWTHQKISDKGT